MRGKKKLGAYYELVANITAEELGHIQLVGAAINSLLNGPETDVQEDHDDDPLKTPIYDVTKGVNQYNPHHFIAAGRTALPVDAGGLPWTGQYVFSSGNLVERGHLAEAPAHLFLHGAGALGVDFPAGGQLDRQLVDSKKHGKPPRRPIRPVARLPGARNPSVPAGRDLKRDRKPTHSR